MRLFIAAELPSELLDALVETQAMLRECMRGRFVAPDSLHVTLAFLGEVDAYRVGDVEAALEAGCAGCDAFEVALAELGNFGRRSKATLWQGFDAQGAQCFTDLAAGVRQALVQEDISFDNKKMLPHVTLMRAADLSGGVLPMPVPARGKVDTVTLFRSDLSGDRPIYEPLYSAQLA